MIYAYQEDVFESLLRSAKAHEIALKSELPIKVRLNRLIIGPTGTGKSHLAELAGRVMGWPVFRINASGWIIWGAKEEPTWRTFATWAKIQDPKVPILVVLDELDKVSNGPIPSDSWSRHMIAELLAFTDKQSPSVLEQEEERETENDPELLKEALQRTLIFGCGAFQDSHEKKSLGFREIAQAPKGLNDLSTQLPRELVNRFSKVLVLPEMQKKDYVQSIVQTARELKRDDAKEYLELAKQMLPKAIEDKTGARFAETVLAELFELKAIRSQTAKVEICPF